MLNKDDPVLKSFIDMAQRDLLTTLGNIEARTLQAGAACASADECYGKVIAQIDLIDNDLQTLINTIRSQSSTISDQNADYYFDLTVLEDPIVEHYSKTLSVLKVILFDFGEEILGTEGDEGAEVFPNNLKLQLDADLVPMYTTSAAFFGWLELQPKIETTSGA